jgi:hypothetical protein
MPIDVAACESTLAELEAKAEDSRRRGDEIGMQRRELAYAAHTGDAKAKKQLDTLNDGAARILLERQDLDAAVLTARARLAEAQRQVTWADEQAALELVPPITQRLRDRAARMDDLALQLVAEAAALRRDVDQLHQAGFNRPVTQLVITGTRRAVQSHFLASILETERIPTDQRHTVAYLAEVWTASIDNEVANRLGPAVADEFSYLRQMNPAGMGAA